MLIVSVNKIKKEVEKLNLWLMEISTFKNN